MKEKDLKKRLEDPDYYYDIVFKTLSANIKYTSKRCSRVRLFKELNALYKLDSEQPKWLLPYLSKLWSLIDKLEHLNNEMHIEVLNPSLYKDLDGTAKDILRLYLKID